MPFKHACFVSYTHGQFSLMQTFIDQVAEALRSELEAYSGDDAVYIDTERLRPGFKYNEALASSLCCSACMVMVYTPSYEQSTYCLREYTAMARLERERLAAMQAQRAGRGLIIPVVLRGNRERLPPAIKDHIHYLDFSRFTTANRRILYNSRYVERIAELAEYIDETKRELEDAGIGPGGDCDHFELPGADDVERWNGGMRRPPPFPGRVG